VRRLHVDGCLAQRAARMHTVNSHYLYNWTMRALRIVRTPFTIVCVVRITVRLWLRVRYRIHSFIHYRYGTVSLTASKQQYSIPYPGFKVL